MHQSVLLACVLVVSFVLYSLCRVRLPVFVFAFDRTLWLVADFTVNAYRRFSKLNQYGIAQVPGPILLRYTDLPLKLHGFQGKRTKYIHALHQSYGS